MKSLLLIAISFLFFSPFLSAQQTVWPGDVNNNGIVNEIDLLYLSFAFGETGNPRTNASSDWIGQTITTEWEGKFPDGLNFIYADCNGDGVVNELDAATIEDNLTKTHIDVPFISDEILTDIPGGSPKFTFFTDALAVAAGQSYQLKIGLGSELSDMQVPNFLGIAFTIQTRPKAVFVPSSSQFTFEDTNWLKDPVEENTCIIHRDTANGNITVAVISTTGMELKGGGGEFGEVSFVIIEDAVDLLVSTSDTISLTIDSITLINDDLERIPLEGATVILDLEGRIISSTHNPILNKIAIYPNPTTGWILLKRNEVPIERVELVNALGQVIYSKKMSQENFQSLDLQFIPRGLYWLKMITEYGVKSTPIQKI